MKLNNLPRYSYCLLFALQAVGQSAEIPKLFNNTALNAEGSWQGNVVPGAGDVALWSNVHTQSWTGGDLFAILNALPPLGGDLSVQGLKITNVGGGRNTAFNVVGFSNTGSTATLTIGSGGIDSSAATQTFLGTSRVLLSADQTWTAVDANTANSTGYNYSEDLHFLAMATGTPFDLGGKTLTVNGAGNTVISSGYTVSNGTIIYTGTGTLFLGSGNSRTTNVADTVNLQVNSGTIRLHSYSAEGATLNPGLTSNAAVTVNGGTFQISSQNDNFGVLQAGPVTLNAGATLNQNIQSTGINRITGNVNVAGNATWSVAGTVSPNLGARLDGNLTGSGNLAVTNNNAGTQVRFNGDNSGYSGTITLGGTAANVVRLVNANAGSAAATWNIGAGKNLEINGVSVQLGTLAGSGNITNIHATDAATAVVGAGNFAGAITNGAGATALTGLTKIGNGTLVASGVNTYTGPTAVQGGTLIATSAQTGATSVSVADGATYGARILAEGTTLALGTGNLNVGTSAGGTLVVDYLTHADRAVPALSVNTLKFSGPSTVQVLGKNIGTGNHPLIQATSIDAASTAVGTLKLVLPSPRFTGALVQSGSNINLNITGKQQVRWSGEVNSNWDISPTVASTAGTANWRLTGSGTQARYVENGDGADDVLFNDQGSNPNVTLTTTLSPLGVTFDANTAAYVLSGPGKLSGPTSIVKNGTATATIANLGENDYTGGTIVNVGTLRIGDGTTEGAGSLNGGKSIALGARLLFDRPGDYASSGTITGVAAGGVGTVEKAREGTLTLSSGIVTEAAFTLTGGNLRFAAGGNLTGVLSGTANLEAGGATLIIGGTDPVANTNTGITSVSAGTLQLSKPDGTNAVGGDINITGTGVLNATIANQIPDTATVRVLGNSADAYLMTGSETFANAHVEGTAGNAQLNLRNGVSITGTATIVNGVLGAPSGATTGTVNRIVFAPGTGNNAIVRVGANTAGSAISIGAGGIEASGGTLEVKYNANNWDAVVNLAGDVNTTGNFAFTNANYNGANLNVLRLSGARTFTIGSGTTTTISSDIADFTGETASLIKAGEGTLVFTNLAAATYTGGTQVNAGVLQVNGPLSGTVQVAGGGVLGGSGTLSGATTVNGGTIAPGAGAASGTLTSSSTVTLGEGSGINVSVSNWAGTAPGTDWDLLAANALVLQGTPANKVAIRVSGSPTGFAEDTKSIVIATSTTPITGFSEDSVVVVNDGFVGSGEWTVQSNGNNIELVYAAGDSSPYDDWADINGLTGADRLAGADPDGDGLSNLEEFALNSDPKSGASSRKVVGTLATIGTDEALTLTLPVLNGTTFAAGQNGELVGTITGVTYRIQATEGLGTWDLAVAEIGAAAATAIQNGLDLPDLDNGWTYRTFRAPGTVGDESREFIRALVEAAAAQ